MRPIPDRPAPDLTTYDARDTDTAHPPIDPLLPAAGAPKNHSQLLDPEEPVRIAMARQ